MTPPAAPRPCECGHAAHPGEVCVAVVRPGEFETFGAHLCMCVRLPEAAPPLALILDTPEGRAAYERSVVGAESAPPRATTPEYPPLELAARNALIAFWDWEHYDNDTVRAERRAALRELSKCVAGCREDRLRASLAGAPPRATTPPDTSAKTLSVDEVNQMFAFAFDHRRAPLAGSPSPTPEYGPLVDVPYEREKWGLYLKLHATREPRGRGKATLVALAEMLAGSPSLESGALLDAYGKAYLAHADDPTPEFHARLADARAAILARLSTLEQDAARIRAAARKVMEIYRYRSMTTPEFHDAMEEMTELLRAPQYRRAALSPSGEPTTTPQQQNQG